MPPRSVTPRTRVNSPSTRVGTRSPSVSRKYTVPPPTSSREPVKSRSGAVSIRYGSGSSSPRSTTPGRTNLRDLYKRVPSAKPKTGVGVGRPEQRVRAGGLSNRYRAGVGVKDAAPKTTRPKITRPKITRPKTTQPRSGTPRSGAPKSPGLRPVAPKPSAPRTGNPRAGNPRAGNPGGGLRPASPKGGHRYRIPGRTPIATPAPTPVGGKNRGGNPKTGGGLRRYNGGRTNMPRLRGNRQFTSGPTYGNGKHYGYGYDNHHHHHGHYYRWSFGFCFGYYPRWCNYGYYGYPYYYSCYYPNSYYGYRYGSYYGWNNYYPGYNACWWWPRGSYYLPSISYYYVGDYGGGGGSVYAGGGSSVSVSDSGRGGSSEVISAGSGGSRGVEPVSKEDLAERHVALGDFYFKKGRYKDAAESYTRALAYAPTDGTLHFVLADALFALGDYHYAAFIIGKAIRLEPELATAEADKRTFYEDPKVFDKQLATLRAYVKDKPYDAAATLVLGYNLLFSGEPDEALKTFKRVLEIEPSNVPALGFVEALEKSKSGAAAGKAGAGAASPSRPHGKPAGKPAGKDAKKDGAPAPSPAERRMK